MKKKNIYEKYFENNIARIVYLISCGLLLYGGFNIVVGNSYWGAIYCVIGVVPFFMVYHKQVSDKHIDELVEKSAEKYLDENIKGKIINKQELNPDDFLTFSGFIRDNGNVRFKSCRDGKMRTSKYYVTAVTIDKKRCMISTTVYDLISDETPIEQFVHITASEFVELTTKESELPKGNFECTLHFENNSDKKEFKFYLPSQDYVAQQFIEKITGYKTT